MTEEEDQKAYEAHHERWMARYGFELPPASEHPLTKKFWELEDAWHEWREGFAWRRLQQATTEREAAFAEPD